MTAREDEFRRACGAFATGVTVITTAVNGVVHGMTANAFLSVSLDPLMVLISLRRGTKLELMLDSDNAKFTVNLLAEHQANISDHFAGRPLGVKPLKPLIEVQPDTWVVRDSAGWLHCEVAERIPAGDHWLFLSLVQDFEAGTHRPLVFHQGSYGQFVGRKIAEVAGELYGWSVA